MPIKSVLTRLSLPLFHIQTQILGPLARGKESIPKATRLVRAGRVLFAVACFLSLI